MNWCAEENVVEHYKDNRVSLLGTIGLIVAPWIVELVTATASER